MAAAAADEPENWECLLCSHVIECFGVFNCGHFMCDTCALRMRTYPAANAHVHHGQSSNEPAYRGASRRPIASLCPVCRAEVKELVITSECPPDDDAFPLETVTRISDRAIPSGSCHARLDGDHAKARVGLLVNFFCPLPQCWETDGATGAASQEAFVSFDLLKEHLQTDHKMRHCKLCLDNRPAFLSEQRVYTDREMDQHHRGDCDKDPDSFAGHPMCLFCSQRFYDGDALLKHMLHKHVTCDFCNAGEFIFVFYKNHYMLDQHFLNAHAVCKHRDCESKILMTRTFRDDFALQSHMAREHGEQQKVSAASLGFTFSNSPNFSPGAASNPRSSPPPAGAGGPLSSSSPANAANTHADRISFDFVNGNVKDVFMAKSARKQQRRGGKGDRGSGAAGGNSDQQSDLAELRKRLNMMLDTYLTEPQRAIMKQNSRGFIDGSTKATEYFKQLEALFPDEQVLNAVFAPLVATLPDPTKREALTAAKTMLTSAEAQRHRKVQEEEAAKRQLEEKRAANRSARQSSARVGATKAAAPKGAWTKSATKVGNASSAWSQPASAPSLGTATKSKAPPSWGAPAPTAAAQPPAAAPATFLDPEAFPTLGSPSGGKKGSARAGAAKPMPKSAWGARR